MACHGLLLLLRQLARLPRPGCAAGAPSRPARTGARTVPGPSSPARAAADAASSALKQPGLQQRDRPQGRRRPRAAPGPRCSNSTSALRTTISTASTSLRDLHRQHRRRLAQRGDLEFLQRLRRESSAVARTARPGNSARRPAADSASWPRPRAGCAAPAAGSRAVSSSRTVNQAMSASARSAGRPPGRRPSNWRWIGAGAQGLAEREDGAQICVWLRFSSSWAASSC